MDNNYKEDKARRSFKRTEQVICKFYVSNDNSRWFEVKLHDISASGAKFYSPKLKVEDVCYIKVNVLSGMSEFSFKTKASLKRIEGENTYAVEFEEMSNTNQIMLDEIINKANVL
ncbi:MAG: PilZ domain-containing protein [Clostridia bacterium]|nr:PilZ domain-containing protein [Clostridia bacterium]